MSLEDVKYLGIVNEIGLERDQDEFSNFNLTVGIMVKTDNKLDLSKGQELVKQLQKELLGKNIELGAIAVPCPVCGKTFNSEFGMKQHMRIVHKKKTRKKRSKKKK
jgi:hypothetical protein